MVFDVDKLKEAVADWDNPPNSDETWEGDRKMGKSLAVLADAARMVVAGQSLWWCEEHESKTKGITGEVCESAINIAYRMGRNPFDRITCRMVEGWWMPTGKDETT